MKNMVSALLTGALALSLAACGGSAQPQDTAASSAQEAGSSAQSTAQSAAPEVAETPETKAPEKTYDSIYDDYSAQLVSAGEAAVTEYKSAAEGITDINELATLANDKIMKLAKICTDGGQEMASLMLANGDEYATYEAAFNKLYAVYNEQGMNVYAAYLDRYAQTVPGMTDELRQQMLDQYQATLEAMAPKANA